VSSIQASSLSEAWRGWYESAIPVSLPGTVPLGAVVVGALVVVVVGAVVVVAGAVVGGAVAMVVGDAVVVVVGAVVGGAVVGGAVVGVGRPLPVLRPLTAAVTAVVVVVVTGCCFALAWALASERARARARARALAFAVRLVRSGRVEAFAAWAAATVDASAAGATKASVAAAATQSVNTLSGRKRRRWPQELACCCLVSAMLGESASKHRPLRASRRGPARIGPSAESGRSIHRRGTALGGSR
jgi:hypothetical protein